MTTLMTFLISGLALSVFFGLYRVFKGPHQLDKVLALDYLCVVGIATVIVLVLITDEPMILDVGICLALVGFLTAYVFAKFAPKEEE